MGRVPGHVLLKKLGKTKLRPGGVEGTSWLFEQVEITKDTKLLEVACNTGGNLIEIAKEHHNHCIGLDQSTEWTEEARKNIEAAGLTEYIDIIQGNALKMPFEDNTFDIVINEAMLTMLPVKAKKKALAEYYRVLKPGGVLLTHDIRELEEDEVALKALQKAVHMPVEPLLLENWLEIFEGVGFSDFKYKSGEFTLLTEAGLLRDEGQEGMKKIMENALTDENREQFMEMMTIFTDPNSNHRYLVMRSKKQ